MFSEKVKRLQVIGGYKFRFHKVLSDDVNRWVCVKSSCKAFRKVDRGGVVVEERVTHNHSKNDAATSNRQRASNAVKRKAKDDNSERPSKLLTTELDADALNNLAPTDVTYPQLPKSILEVHVAPDQSDPQTKLDLNSSEQFLVSSCRPQASKSFVTYTCAYIKM